MKLPAWYTHGFNSASSLRLILGIIPRLPRWLVPPLGVGTTALFMTLLPRERRAVARNQARILGVRGWRRSWAVWRQFYSFSRLMTSYADLTRLPTAELEQRLTADLEGTASMEQALGQGRGVVVLTAHLGNWEAGTRFLERFGVPVNVVMHADRSSAAERWLLRRRRSAVVNVLRTGDHPMSMLKVQAALSRNEIVAMQGDRAFGRHALSVRLFGAPFTIPLGPFRVAALCGAPILPAFVLQDGWWRWRAELGPPLPLAGGGDLQADLASAAARYAERLEGVVRRHPDQWFQFFDLWSESADPAGSDLEARVAHEDQGIAMR